MAGNHRNVNVGRDAVAAVVVTGDGNNVHSNVHGLRNPHAPAVDVVYELARIRTLALSLRGLDADKVIFELVRAAGEARKANPDKNAVGAAVERTIGHMKEASGFVEDVSKIAPHVANAVQ